MQAQSGLQHWFHFHSSFSLSISYVLGPVACTSYTRSHLLLTAALCEGVLPSQYIHPTESWRNLPKVTQPVDGGSRSQITPSDSIGDAR